MKKLSLFAFPIIVSQLIAQLMVISDIWMMSQISIETMAAGGLAASVYSFLFIIANSVISVAANLLSITIGQRNIGRAEHSDIRMIVQAGVLLAIVLTILFLPIFYMLPKVFDMLGQDPAIVAQTMLYLHAVKWSMLPTLLILVLRSLPIACGYSRSVLFLTVVLVLANFSLSYWLAFQLGLGIEGLGWGTTLASLFMAFIYGAWLFSNTIYKAYRPWYQWRDFQFSSLVKLTKMGGAVATATATECCLISGAALFAGTLGTVYLAVHQIALQVLTFSWSIAFGFSQATAMKVGTLFGANAKVSEIKAVVTEGLLLVSISSLVIGSLFIVYPELLVKMFVNPDDVLFGQLTLVLPGVMVMAASCFLVDAWQLITLNILRGMRIVAMPVYITAFGYCFIGLPASWLLMGYYQLEGIWMGVAIGLGATGILLLLNLLVAFKNMTGKEQNNADVD